MVGWWRQRDSNPRFGLERADTDQQASLAGGLVARIRRGRRRLQEVRLTRAPFDPPNPSVRATTGEFTGLKIPGAISSESEETRVPQRQWVPGEI